MRDHGGPRDYVSKPIYVDLPIAVPSKTLVRILCPDFMLNIIIFSLFLFQESPEALEIYYRSYALAHECAEYSKKMRRSRLS
jgi:hypothetical protein